MTTNYDSLIKVLAEGGDSIVTEWLQELGVADTGAQRKLREEAGAVTKGLLAALKAGADTERISGAPWASLNDTLSVLSGNRAAQGQTAGDTSRFVLAFKKPLFTALQSALANDSAALLDAVWSASTLVDKLAQRTVDIYQQTREDIIGRQQQELLELSTPVIKLWDGILAVPMIGTLDSNRTQLVMETLLQKIVETESSLAIIDITGVPTVDTLVAQHLLKTVAAIRLMGADCIISGIRPQIAQTIVHLGIDLQGISSKSSLADALSLALHRTGYRISRDA